MLADNDINPWPMALGNAQRSMSTNRPVHKVMTLPGKPSPLARFTDDVISQDWKKMMSPKHQLVR